MPGQLSWEAGSWEAGQNWESITDERSELGDMTSGRSVVSRVGLWSTGSTQCGKPGDPRAIWNAVNSI